MRGMGLNLLLVLLALMAANLAFAQVHISGPLSGVLVADTYLVVDSILVQPLDSLVIMPGAELLFGGYFNFRIYGYLSAIGTEADSIFFGPAPGVDSLRSITFLGGSSDSSRMAYCHITGCAESAINVYSVPITIEHCTITDNTANWGGGIYCSAANATISECVITNNICRNNGGGIYATNCSPTITNCIVTGNLCNTLPTSSSGRGGGGICANHSASPVITGCVISDNHSIWNGGGISINDNSDMTLSYCLITDNSCDSSGGGIAMFSYCDPVISNCTLSRDSAAISGGGLYIEQCNPTIVNTIVEGNSGEGGIYFAASPTSTLAFSDFNNPSTDNFAGMLPPGLGGMDTVNANGDSCDAFANIFLDPLFAIPSEGDFSLQEASPCIDAGDPASPLDPDSTVADIGAFYFYHIEPVAPEHSLPANFAFQGPYPNPFNATTVASFELRVPSYVSLKVYDTAGRLVQTLVDEWREAGRHEIMFNGSHLASGIYIYRLEAGEFKASGKMVLLK